AYPFATLTLYLIIRALISHRVVWIGAALAASVVGFKVRDELIVLLAAFGLAACFLAWGGPRWTRWRRAWSRSDWIGFAVLVIGLYTAAKATYVSTTFGTYTYERNLIYLAPLLFAGTALWLERRAARPIAVGLAGAFALYVILTTGYEMGQDISYNAPGLAILQQSNRCLALAPGGAKIVLLVVRAF